MNDYSIKVVDKNANIVYTGFTLGVVPSKGDIIQNAGGLQFEVLQILHRKHDYTSEHVVEVHIGEAL